MPSLLPYWWILKISEKPVIFLFLLFVADIFFFLFFLVDYFDSHFSFGVG
jgi:hypothetical protein